MKIRAIFLSLLICCGIFSTSFSKDLSGTKPVNEPDTESVKEKNIPLLIKERILYMKDQLEIDEDRFPKLIQEMEAYTSSCADSSAIAVLHSMTAELYQKYYQQHRWKIDQRSRLKGYVPDDLREWSSNLFQEKIQQEIERSLQSPQILQNTSTRSFSALLNIGKDTESLRPTLFEFLAFRAVQIQPSAEIYKRIIAFQNKKPNMKAVVLTELEYYRFLYDQKRDKAAFNLYLNALNDMYRNHATQDYAIEILIAKLDLVGGSRYRYFTNKEHAVQAEEIEICKEGIRRFPNYPRTAALRNRLAILEQPSLSVSNPNTIYPGNKVELKVSYKNIEQINVKVFRSLKSPLKAEQDKNIYRSDEKRGDLVKDLTFSLNLPNSYTQQDTTLFIPMNDLGLYECFVYVPNHDLKTINTFSVSRFAGVYRSTSNDLREVLVTDLKSGKPVSKATVTYYTDRRMRLKAIGSVKTDKNGIAVLPDDQPITAFQTSKGDDRFGMLSMVYFRGQNLLVPEEEMQVSLFTDRGIYRPGQTLFFKGLAYVKDTEQPHSLPNQTFTVRLQDANGKEIAKKECKTNDFGSFHGEFTIPSYCLSGSFRLSTNRTNTYVRVEEYKRPSFQVSVLPIQKAITFGDAVTIEGKAETFSGISLPEGTVKWSIMRRPFWLRYYTRHQSESILAEGETKLNEKGLFQVSFCPQKEDTHRLLSAYQSYDIWISVTDSKGETQETRYSFVVGESSLVLSSSIPQQTDRNKVEAIIEAQTVNGEKQTVSGSFRILQLTDNPDKRKKNDFLEKEEVVAGTFTSGQPIESTVFKNIPSGRYRLAFEAKDDKGRLCKNFTDFILYGTDDKRPPVFSHTWVLPEKVNCVPGEKAEFIFGTSDKEAYVLYEWFVDQKRIHSERIKMSNENRRFYIPFSATYKNGLVATFTFVKEGELYVSQIPVKRQLPNRKLNICPMSFRDHLLPGQGESWQFRITDADSLAVSAEVLASMYDASLDQLLPFSWYFSPERQIHLHAPKFAAGTGFLRNYQYDQESINHQAIPSFKYDCLNWFELFGRERTRIFPTNHKLMMKAAGDSMMDIQENEVETDREGLKSLETNPYLGATERAKEASMGLNHVRKDFSETAFFYPTVRTNEKGDFLLNFKVPESNTTWKLQLLANTKDLKYGQFTQEIVTNKPLMIVPNLPRFVRQGDQVNIRAQIINHSKERTSGRVSIELFDPKNNEPIICLSKSLRMFDLLTDSVATVQWTIPVPKGIDLMGIRLIAHSNNRSDGEQHILPVLSNQLLVTESKPFYLPQPGAKRIHVSNNESGKTPFRLTLELTSNPIWYAVQALPTIAEPSNDNILSWFAAFYSNTLATYIAQANPRIQEVITQWAAKGTEESRLYSNLVKNQELKNILLEETPWVLTADKETEQKQRLSLLFNINRSNHLRNSAIRQLSQQQNENGGWSWFKGLPTNRSITLSILEGMAQLVQLNAYQSSSLEKEMQIKALKYLDECIVTDYEHILKSDGSKQNVLPSPEQIRYLYVRSLYRDIPELGKAREAIRFFTKRVEKEWKKLSLHEKGEVALLMHHNGKKEIASTILNWFQKTASQSNEKGMYWANNRRSQNYFTSPIETHCLIMSAFETIRPNMEQANQMKQWLLNQKRTQNWESEPATVQAIYALLLTGDDWLNNKNVCSVQWGNQTFSSSEGEIATGYLKKVLPLVESPTAENKQTLEIRKEGNHPSWGALYEQYFQDITAIKEKKGVLQIEKHLFIETMENDLRKICPIHADQPLQIGDKVIVRMIIRSDRDMDYVYLKDVRAGCFEPAEPISKSESRDGIWYYRSPKDASENFYFDHLPQGTFVIEYPLYITRSGNYASGISTIQCLYAPEFTSHTSGDFIRVKK